MVNPAVPARIRRLINVESGLNDGIATPFVLIAIAGAARGRAREEYRPGGSGRRAGAGRADRRGDRWRRRLAGEGGPPPATGPPRASPGRLCWPSRPAAYASSLALHGNGFIAAFVGGLAYGALSGRRGERLVPFVEEAGGLVSLLVWLAFGAIAVVPALQALSWQTALYAVASLTVIRMVPVALALAGGRLGRTPVLFIGWFGPRGLASVVFALLALEDLGPAVAERPVAIIAFTVLLSVVLHGVTADPLARRYGSRLALPPAAGPAEAELAERRLIRHRPAA